MLKVIFFLYLCPNLGQLTVWKIKYKLLTFHSIQMTSFRFHYENDASYLFCSDGSCKMNPDFSQGITTRNNIQHDHRPSWKFVCIWCIFVKLFWILIYKRNSKRHYPDNKNGKLLPPINERRSWKKCHFYKAPTHSLTTFGLPGLDKIVSCTFFLKLKQVLIWGVIYPT